MGDTAHNNNGRIVVHFKWSEASLRVVTFTSFSLLSNDFEKRISCLKMTQTRRMKCHSSDPKEAADTSYAIFKYPQTQPSIEHKTVKNQWPLKWYASILDVTVNVQRNWEIAKHFNEHKWFWEFRSFSCILIHNENHK